MCHLTVIRQTQIHFIGAFLNGDEIKFTELRKPGQHYSINRENATIYSSSIIQDLLAVTHKIFCGNPQDILHPQA